MNVAAAGWMIAFIWQPAHKGVLNMLDFNPVMSNSVMKWWRLAALTVSARNQPGFVFAPDSLSSGHCLQLHYVFYSLHCDSVV